MKKRWNLIPKWARKVIQYTIVATFWFCVWLLAARGVGESLLLPTPQEVFSRLLELSATKDFWVTVVTSLGRIVYGVLLAVLSGVILAVATHFVPFLYTLFYPLITVVRSTPVASFIILAYLWIDRDSLPSFIAVLMVLPVVWANLHEALGGVEKGLLEMASVFHMAPSKKLTKIYLPSVMPAFIASCRSLVGLAWKAGVAAEILIVPLVSIGRMLSEAKLYLETVDLFAWTATVILMSLLLELVLLCVVRLLRPEKKVSRKPKEVTSDA